MKIPKRIFQIALGDEYIQKIPRTMLKDTILKKNPDYIYELLTDIECISLIQTHYPEYMDLYNRLERPQYKSDLVRYLSLHKDGGFYVDIDLLPLVGFDAFASDFSSFFTIGAHHNGKLEMANGFIGSVPGNSLFITLVNIMRDEPNPQDYGMNVKRMYHVLNHTIGVQEYTKVNDTYFLREQYSSLGFYIINIAQNDTICISNCSGYPYSVTNVLKFLE
jgi:mannosyltransferase OCH1-like enzyme